MLFCDFFKGQCRVFVFTVKLVLCYSIKISIDFWRRRDLISKSLRERIKNFIS